MNNKGINSADYPLIVFVHVPKTGGVTVENALLRLSPRGHGNVHALSENQILSILDDVDWISGHLTRSYFNSVLGWISPIDKSGDDAYKRKVEYYSVVRDPVRQLISILNYSFARQNIESYILSKNRDEEMLDADVLSSDFTNPYAIKSLLFKHQDLYSNCQSRFILGSSFNELSDADIERRIRSYTYIGETSDLSSLYSSFGFAGETGSLANIRENASNMFFDDSIFYEDCLKAFLREYLSVDLRLYDLVRKVEFNKCSRRPIRPSLRVLPKEQFSEAGYLAANPEVARAIEGGEYLDGREHFEKFGIDENRRIAVFP